MDLAKAKSEALVNIYSLPKQNINRVTLTKRRRQRKQQKNNRSK